MEGASCVIMLVLLSMSMFTLIPTARSVEASYVTEKGKVGTIHWGNGLARNDEYFNFGIGSILWSLCSLGAGYFYGSSFSTPTLYFADKIGGYFGSYDSYQGVHHIWDFTNASVHEWFTEHGIWFASESWYGLYTGILLIRQGDLYGAIRPKSVHDGDNMSPPEDFVLEYDWWYDDSGNSDFSLLECVAAVDIYPEMLNLRSCGQYTTAYVELPEGYNASDIVISSVKIGNTVAVDPDAPWAIGDYDNDAVPDLTVAFSRAAVSGFILSNGFTTGNVTLVVTGRLNNGTRFGGDDTITARLPGDINMDGRIDGGDIIISTRAFGSFPEHPRWNPMADENEDGVVDGSDLVLVARDFGKSFP